MPNHNRTDKDLNGGKLFIRGTEVIDTDRNLRVKTLKTDSIGIRDQRSVLSTAFNEGQTDATANTSVGCIETPVATTSAESDFLLDINNTSVTASSIVLATIHTYNGAGIPVITEATPSANLISVRVANAHSSSALNSNVKISFLVIN